MAVVSESAVTVASVSTIVASAGGASHSMALPLLRSVPILVRTILWNAWSVYTSESMPVMASGAPVLDAAVPSGTASD